MKSPKPKNKDLHFSMFQSLGSSKLAKDDSSWVEDSVDFRTSSSSNTLSFWGWQMCCHPETFDKYQTSPQIPVSLDPYGKLRFLPWELFLFLTWTYILPTPRSRGIFFPPCFWLLCQPCSTLTSTRRFVDFGATWPGRCGSNGLLDTNHVTRKNP